MQDIVQQEIEEYRRFLNRINEENSVTFAQRRIMQGVTESAEEEWHRAVQEILRKEDEVAFVLEVSLEFASNCEREMKKQQNEIAQLQYALMQQNDVERTNKIQKEQIELYQEQIKIVQEENSKLINQSDELTVQLHRLRTQSQIEQAKQELNDGGSVRKSSHDVKSNTEMRTLQTKLDQLSKELEENKSKLDEEKREFLNLRNNYLKVQEKMHELETKHSRVSSQNEQLINALAAAHKAQLQAPPKIEVASVRGSIQGYDSFISATPGPVQKLSMNQSKQIYLPSYNIQAHNQSFNGANRFSSYYGNILDGGLNRINEETGKRQSFINSETPGQSESLHSSEGGTEENNLIYSNYLHTQMEARIANTVAKGIADSPNPAKSDFDNVVDDLMMGTTNSYDQQKMSFNSPHTPEQRTGVKNQNEDVQTEKLRMKYRQNSNANKSMFIRKIQNYEPKQPAQQFDSPHKETLKSFKQSTNNDFLSMIQNNSFVEANQLTDPYEIFFILTTQCAKLNSKYFNQVTNINTLDIYNQLKWYQYIEKELEEKRKQNLKRKPEVRELKF